MRAVVLYIYGLFLFGLMVALNVVLTIEGYFSNAYTLSVIMCFNMCGLFGLYILGYAIREIARPESPPLIIGDEERGDADTIAQQWADAEYEGDRA